MKRSYLIAAAILLAVSLWMLSGLFIGRDEAPAQSDAGGGDSAVTRVEVAHFRARPMLREVVVQGQSLAKRTVTLKAELAGEVDALMIDKGAAVARGETLMRLAENERPQRLRQARALVQQRELEYEAARSLRAKGLQAERQLAEAVSLLRSARLQLKSAELDMQRLTIKSPFDGVVQSRHVEQGDYLQPGDPLYTIVALDPLVVRGDVAESEVGALETGMAATVELSNGAKLAGSLTYIAPVADSRTRTFAIEMEAENPAPQQPGGMSATLRLPLETTAAHQVTPALLSLSDAGVLGLKGVDGEGMVQFYPVKILKSERAGIWVGGLPQEVDLITVGQGFVRAGDRVEVVRGPRAADEKPD